MSINGHYKFWRLLLPITVGVIFLFIPLLGDFHIESAVLVSLIGCYWAGIWACKEHKESDDFWQALRISGYLFLVGLPLLVKALLTGCFSIHGLAFWLVFPLPSVFFGYAVGRLFRLWKLPYRKSITAVTLSLVAIGIFLYELLSYPQVAFYNHVWGGWPGPIYDEVVQINQTAVYFRSLTVLWVLFLWNIPTINRDKDAKWIVGLAAIAIVFSYTKLTDFGVISPRFHLQEVLGSHKTSQHFELYYDRYFYSDYEIDLLAKEHEFYFRQISEQLELDPRDTTSKIESYLYAHPWQKKQLVGAKFTSYVPVWLKQDQLHIAKEQIENSLKHELVHVAAKQFGNKLFNASWSIGLIEGLAVAVDGGSSSTSTIDQIVVSEKPYPSAKELQQSFSPWGFYGGRSGVNYITSGSFVRFLMQNYPIESFKKAYRSADLGTSFEKDWQVLTREWHQHLDSIKVDSIDEQMADRIFGIPSLFEQKCPHVVSDFVLAWDNYQLHKAEGDTTLMLEALDKALAASDSIPNVKAEWSYRHLLNGDIDKVRQTASPKDTTAELQLLYADAAAMSGKQQQAQLYIKRAQELYEQSPDSLLKPALDTRKDSTQWVMYREMTYKNQLPDSAEFTKANYRTKIRSLRKALNKEYWGSAESYARTLLPYPVQIKYFDDYLQLIHKLGFKGELEIARQWIGKLRVVKLRQRYKERLEQEQLWLKFLESTNKNTE
jgi:hypothetical protein